MYGTLDRPCHHQKANSYIYKVYVTLGISSVLCAMYSTDHGDPSGRAQSEDNDIHTNSEVLLMFSFWNAVAPAQQASLRLFVGEDSRWESPASATVGTVACASPASGRLSVRVLYTLDRKMSRASKDK